MLLYMSLFIGLMVGIWDGYSSHSSVYHEWSAILVDSFLAFIVTCVFACMFSLLISTIGENSVRDMGQGTTIGLYTNYYEIISIRDGDSLNGKFFIGCGSIGGVDKYIMYKKLGKNQFKQEQINAQDVTLIQSNEESPRVQWVMRTAKPNWTVSMTPNHTITYIYGDYKIYVPEETIIKRFEVK